MYHYNLFDDDPFDTHDNPFAEPRTMPRGWSTTDFLADRKRRAVPATEDLAQLDEVGETMPSGMEKFPKPSTTPKNWDVSNLK
jgi:hypothetical protein